MDCAIIKNRRKYPAVKTYRGDRFMNQKTEHSNVKKLQTNYNLLQILYWISICANQGYVAIYLQNKGLQNTEIGLVTGISCILNIFVSLFLSSLPQKIKGLTIRGLLDGMTAVSFTIFLCISYVPLPKFLIMAFYMAMLCISISAVPLLSAIAMDYIRQGKELNFGLSRGMASASYAVSAVVIGQCVDFFDPDILSVIYLLTSLIFLAVLHGLPAQGKEAPSENRKKEKNLFVFIRKYRILFFILAGYSLNFAGAASISTYLINIVKGLGGGTMVYSIAIFIMALSEMPVMTFTRRLMRRYDTMNLIMVSGICYLFRNILICIAPHILFVFAGMLFQSMSFGLLTSLLAYYVADVCDKEDEVMGQSLIAVMTSGVGGTIGNVLGGILQDHMGMNAMLLFIIGVTITGSVIMIVTGYQYKTGSSSPHVNKPFRT